MKLCSKLKMLKNCSDVGGFEICPDDEVTFQSLLSPEELKKEVEKQSHSRFQLLDQTSPTVSSYHAVSCILILSSLMIKSFQYILNENRLLKISKIKLPL
jgi:hypothetical protein